MRISYHILYMVLPSCSVLDDLEMYEQQKPFTISDYTTMSAFLNNFTYKVWSLVCGLALLGFMNKLIHKGASSVFPLTNL